MPVEQGNSSRNLITALAGLVVLVLVTYWPSLHGEYVRLDDFQYVVDNELVRRPSWAAAERFFAEVTKPSTVEGYYQPLTMVSLMLDVVLAGGGEHPGPYIFHLTNVLLHAANAVLVVLLMRRIVGGLAIPLLIGVLFAVHPAQVESVSWISQRKTVLATFFALACVVCYLRYGEAGRKRSKSNGGQQVQEQPASKIAGSWGWLAAAAGLYVLAGLAKPTVMLLPLVLPLLDFWPLRRPPLRSLPEKLPFLIIMVPMCWVAWVSQASAATLQRPTLMAEGAAARWIGLLCYNIMLYAGNVVWPFDLSPYRAIASDLGLTNPPIALAVAGTIALLAVWATSARWSRPLFVGLAAFGIILLPALGPVRFMGSCVADRFTYLPMVFVLLPLAALAKQLQAAQSKREWIVWVGLGSFAVPLISLMHAQQAVWQNSKALWTHVAAAVPDFMKAQTNLAMVCLEEEKWEEAENHARRVLAQNPEDADCLHVLGLAYTRTGRAEEAIAILQKALRIGLGRVQPTGYLSLAEAYLVSGDDAAAREACEKAIAAGRTPADTYAAIADTAMRFGRRYDLAVGYYRLAVERKPDSILYHWTLGTAILYAGGPPEEALREYEQAIANAAKHGARMPELEAEAAKLRQRIEKASTGPSGR
ncbi:MAG TPA: tetratricopeptide repeat protein [Phycisphaerae bacterium]|nr:tetratricopeptide repeat protein [Phycisphaerae bacterium]